MDRRLMAIRSIAEMGSDVLPSDVSQDNAAIRERSSLG
jgi:hypothetical protein